MRSNDAYRHYLEDIKNVGDNITFTVLHEGMPEKVNLTVGAVPLFFLYENPDEGIEILYPSDWDVSEENLGISDIVKFFSSQQSLTEEGEAAAGAFVKLFPAGEFGLDTMARQETQGSATTRNLHVNFSELGGLPA